ncbi:unnamed protein product [Diplocarpon coronariae]
MYMYTNHLKPPRSLCLPRDALIPRAATAATAAPARDGGPRAQSRGRASVPGPTAGGWCRAGAVARCSVMFALASASLPYLVRGRWAWLGVVDVRGWTLDSTEAKKTHRLEGIDQRAWPITAMRGRIAEKGMNT